MANVTTAELEESLSSEFSDLGVDIEGNLIILERCKYTLNFLHLYLYFLMTKANTALVNFIRLVKLYILRYIMYNSPTNSHWFFCDIVS